MLDIAIVGFGPVGQALAVLLGQAGHRVGAFERFQEAYRMPRAVHIDHEVMRILQATGVADRLLDDLLPVSEYHWLGADGDPVMVLQSPAPAISGWEPDYLFHQPVLEAALEERARELDTVTVARGATVTGIEERDDHVELRVDDSTVAARWVVGCDGANSFVREALGIERRDLGFQERWFVVDVEPHDMNALDLPAACQWCDPRRPTTHVRSGQRHRRWEFMLLPGEHPANFGEERAWELLAPWFGPDDGELARHTVYEFRSMLAERMRKGRVLLAGDAAHLTPPFLGQGLGAGLRDALNIAWKLDLVLRGLAGDALLDTISTERQPQTEFLISFAIELGKVLCELDPGKAPERDATLRDAGPPPPVAAVPIGDGVSSGDIGRTLAVQPRLELDGRQGLADDLTGGGFTLLARTGDPLDVVSADQRAFVASLGCHVVSLAHARDLDGRATAFLDEHGLHAVLVRPDFYAFGGVTAPDEIPALVDDLRNQLQTSETKETRMTTTDVVHPTFHHLNLKTTRLDEMIGWYGTVVGAEVNFRDDVGAWLSNDKANHRIALLAFPTFSDDPEKDTHTGLHHSAFEYASFDELNGSYLRLRDAGIEPDFCIDHGMAFSYYYKDPDGNHVELQVDNFGNWDASAEWMRTSPEFAANPIGVFVDPDRVAEAAADGASFEEIHARAMEGAYAPEQQPVEIPEG